MHKVGIIGHGHIGSRLAIGLHNGGHDVWATKRNPCNQETKYPLIQCQLPQNIDVLKQKANESTLIFLLSPTNEFYIESVNSLIDHLDRQQRLIFFSSTSVFGDAHENCDETTTPSPTSKNGKLLLKCEQKLQSYFQNLKIIRPSGIVDEQRNPLNFFEKTKLIQNANLNVNLIHSDDIVQYVQYVIDNYVSAPKMRNLVSLDKLSKNDFYNGLRRLHKKSEIEISITETHLHKKILSNYQTPSLKFPLLFDYFKERQNA